MDYEYFRVEESEQFSFFRIPKALFTEKEFEGLSTDAKLLYGILLDRINLSKKKLRNYLATIVKIRIFKFSPKKETIALILIS